jgi:hypothetical protein
MKPLICAFAALLLSGCSYWSAPIRMLQCDTTAIAQAGDRPEDPCWASTAMAEAKIKGTGP